MALDLRSSELEYSFIKERISNLERHFSEIAAKLSAYNKRLAYVRDCGDDLSKSISSFASKENLNCSLRSSLLHFSDILKALQEYRDAQIQRIDVKVVLEFSNYKPICKKAKNDLKTSFEVRAKELSKKNELEKMRGKNPTNWQKIAEKEVSQAQVEATRTTLELSKKLDHFEKQKLEDIKHAFLEFIRIELLFHTKAIELYTTAYNTVKNIKVDDDLKEFRSHFRSYTSPSKLGSVSTTNIQNKMLTAYSSSADLNVHVNKTADDTVNISNTSLKSIHSITPDHAANASNTSFKSPQKKIQGLQKPSHSRMDNSTSSFDSAVEPKFEFGDHCL